tara:strand:+ start:2325 stop:4124 length:1800 start_codon:yes stop_codon:yes gene_type:complete
MLSVTEKTNKELKVTKSLWADISAIWSKTEAPGMGSASSKGFVQTSAGGVPNNGNFLKTGVMYGAMKAAGGLGIPMAVAQGAVHYGSEIGKAAWSYAGGRVDANAGYSLTADRTGMLMRQMYGGTQLDYQSRWRKPLAGGLLGQGGVEQMLKLQTTLGINPTSMLKDVEAVRVASGFGYTTEDATKMITQLASPGSSNLMTMMMGKGFWGPGGEARGVMPLVNNIIKRMDLDSTDRITGALQSGSMTRSNLSRMGLPEDMQDMVLQIAQQNVQFKEVGGKGMYDPSNERHRRMMGVDDAYAMEEQRTRVSEVQRSEKFYGRQVDNYAQLERNTQGLIEKFTQLDEVLSGIIGAKASLQNKWWLRVAGKIPGLGAIGGLSGDTEHLRDAGMNSGFASSLQKMKSAADSAGVPLSLTSGTRDSGEQEMLFRSRHSPVGDVEWGGQAWSLNQGASPAAPPGSSLHELGYAADLGPPESYGWIAANAGKFGLRNGAAQGEPWHVAPANITSASQVTGKRATSVATPRPSSPVGDGERYGYSRNPSARGMRAGSTTYTQGSSVVISPTINLNGSGNTAADTDMLANRIISMIESSEAVRALRRS